MIASKGATMILVCVGYMCSSHMHQDGVHAKGTLTFAGPFDSVQSIHKTFGSCKMSLILGYVWSCLKHP